MDGVHDLLLRIGDLSREELRERCVSRRGGRIGNARLFALRRVIEISVAGEKRLIAVEDAARYRDALGVPLPPGLPIAFLQPAAEALQSICCDGYARTHGPFTTQAAAARFASAPRRRGSSAAQTGADRDASSKVDSAPVASIANGATTEVLRTIRRKSLARLRKEVEPVEQRTLARLLHPLAGRRPATARPRCTAGHHRKSAGITPSGFHPRNRDSARASTALQIVRPRYC